MVDVLMRYLYVLICTEKKKGVPIIHIFINIFEYSLNLRSSCVFAFCKRKKDIIYNIYIPLDIFYIVKIYREKY